MICGSKLGEGTFGIVYSAVSPSSHKEYAIKRNLIAKETSFIGVSREVDVLNKLRHHPHIVHLERVAFDQPFSNRAFSPLVGEDRADSRDDTLHFIFGKAAYDLYTYIYHTHDSFTQTKRLMTHLLLACEYMHSRQIVHRDLKPNNVLIFDNEQDVLNQSGVVKICDFGLAKPFTYQGEQTPSTVTAWYRAPEIALGYPHYDYKIDIWAIGCIFFEIFARRPFIEVPDDDNKVLSTILRNLPYELSLRKFRELIRLNKWRKISLSPNYNVSKRKSWLQQLSLTKEGRKVFEDRVGSMEAFCDLLTKMLQFEWEQRATGTECLDHPFFHDQRALITATREKHRCQPYREEKILIKNCIERKWMSEVVTQLFNERSNYAWFNNRALFQAMDLFDRYLTVMFHHLTVPANAVESKQKGLLHSKSETILRFLTCLYLCLKYFSSIHKPISFETILPPEFQNAESHLIAEQFESGFIKNCLEYNIYRPTIYEVADKFDEKLDEVEIRNLIILYSMNNSIHGLKPSELYQYYCQKLRGQELETLLLPIQLESV